MNKSIFVSGANRGLGLELVRQYLAAGNEVIAACRNPGAADELRELAQAGSRLSLLELDVRDPRSVARLAAALDGKRLDMLFNVAGIFGPPEQGIDWQDFEQWLDIYSVNAIGPWRVTQALLPNLASGASVITLSSKVGASDWAFGGVYAYGSSKAALNRIVQGVARDLRSQGIIVVAMCPGWVRTDMGGSTADLEVDVSVAGICRVADTLTIEDSGSFIHWDGRRLPW